MPRLPMQRVRVPLPRRRPQLRLRHATTGVRLRLRIALRLRLRSRATALHLRRVRRRVTTSSIFHPRERPIMLRKLSSIAMCFNLFMHAGQIGPLEEALRHHVKAHDAAVGCSELRPALGQAGTAKTGHEERAAIG